MELTETGLTGLVQLAKQANTDVRTLTDDRGQAYVLRQENEALQPYGPAPKPAFICECVTLSTTQSLIDYLARFKTATTVIFADAPSGTICAMIDYHGPSLRLESKVEPSQAYMLPGNAEHVAHRAKMTLRKSEAWATWTGANNKMMGQLDFARLIEENRADIVSPDGAKLLEIVLAFNKTRTATFSKAVRTDSNNETFSFSEDIANTNAKKGEIDVPTFFTLRIPVFYGEDPIEIRAQLRWHLKDDLSLGLALQRPKQAMDEAFETVVDRLKVADCPIYFS